MVRAAATYIVTDLGTLSGTYSEAHSINDSGQVVGYSSSSLGGNHAFLYSGGGMTNLGTLGGSASNALAINKSGQVAGWSYTSGTFGQRAFLYSGGEMTNLGTLYPGGGGTSVATGINDPGQVVGYTTDSTGYQKAFLYTDSTMFNLGTLPDGTTSNARAINGIGQVVGWSYYNGTNAQQAFLYSGDTMIPLGFLPNGHSSVAMAINSTGQVAGSSTFSDGWQTHAFLTGDGGLQDLDSLGGSVSTAWGINDAGQVVGSSSIEGDTADHAFLYSEGEMIDLSELEEVSAAGWTSLTRAYDINNVGQITGEGSINGEYHGFLLTPAPAPETGDSAGLENPQAVASVANGISGTIGGTDIVDVFSFNWSDSSEMKVRLSDPTGELGSLYLSLLAFDSSELVPAFLLSPDEWISLGFREAGNYLLKVATSSAIDPPFTLDLLGTGTGPAIGPPLAPSVPEPSALALLVLGLMGLGAMQRKKLAA